MEIETHIETTNNHSSSEPQASVPGSRSVGRLDDPLSVQQERSGRWETSDHT
jgi:hypothetical protein